MAWAARRVRACMAGWVDGVNMSAADSKIVIRLSPSLSDMSWDALMVWPVPCSSLLHREWEHGC
jgi:hypothetical protein